MVVEGVLGRVDDEGVVLVHGVMFQVLTRGAVSSQLREDVKLRL